VTDEAKISKAAQTNLLTQTKAAQQSVSGVNLDEEAANLLRYQQAYQAAAQIIKSASSMFDTLLSLGG
jgi:flagellar hook-associated protein 1 FlgK